MTQGHKRYTWVVEIRVFRDDCSYAAATYLHHYIEATAGDAARAASDGCRRADGYQHEVEVLGRLHTYHMTSATCFIPLMLCPP
jgi:hypothetical protein